MSYFKDILVFFSSFMTISVKSLVFLVQIRANTRECCQNSLKDQIVNVGKSLYEQQEGRLLEFSLISHQGINHK